VEENLAMEDKENECTERIKYRTNKIGAVFSLLSRKSNRYQVSAAVQFSIGLNIRLLTAA
jgi:hypothetical protein